MTDYELAIHYRGLGIKEVEVSAEELVEWLDRTAEDFEEGKADNILRFKVEKEGFGG